MLKSGANANNNDDDDDDDDDSDSDDDEDGVVSNADEHDNAGRAYYNDQPTPRYAHSAYNRLHHEEPAAPRTQPLTGGGGYGLHHEEDEEQEHPTEPR